MLKARSFAWMALLALLGAAACSGAEGPSEETLDSSQEALKPTKVGEFCGGIAGIPCPDGQKCIDDPNDDCDPKHGGADCGGICIGPSDCGGVMCGKGMVCCNPLKGLCTKPGMACTQ